MRCPVCKEMLVIVEYQEIEVDFCVECGGVWLDAGELELLLGEGDEAYGTMMGAGDLTAASREAKRKCPDCGKLMLKETDGGENAVMYDRCPRGDGLWFDKGELTTLLKRRHALAGGEMVADHLAQMFAAPPSGLRNEEGMDKS